jgi:hypothetical protein
MINRRGALAGIGGLALAAAAPAWPRARLDLADRRDRLTAIAKMRGSTDGRLTIGYVIGTRYAVPEHRAIPMMGIMAATFSQYQRISDEAFEARAIEIGYFTDIETGKLLESWKNPVTGTVVEVPQTRMGPSLLRITADGLTVARPDGPAGLELKHRFLEPVVVGDDVWITEEIHVAGPPAARPFVYNELSTYRARKSELDEPALAVVPTHVDYQSLITYRDWMGFGDAPGHTIARGAGTRATRAADLPPHFVDLTRRHHPDVLADPLKVLAGASRG